MNNNINLNHIQSLFRDFVDDKHPFSFEAYDPRGSDEYYDSLNQFVADFIQYFESHQIFLSH